MRACKHDVDSFSDLLTLSKCSVVPWLSHETLGNTEHVSALVFVIGVQFTFISPLIHMTHARAHTHTHTHSGGYVSRRDASWTKVFLALGNRQKRTALFLSSGHQIQFTFCVAQMKMIAIILA